MTDKHLLEARFRNRIANIFSAAYLDAPSYDAVELWTLIEGVTAGGKPTSEQLAVARAAKEYDCMVAELVSTPRPHPTQVTPGALAAASLFVARPHTLSSTRSMSLVSPSASDLSPSTDRTLRLSHYSLSRLPKTMGRCWHPHWTAPHMSRPSSGREVMTRRRFVTPTHVVEVGRTGIKYLYGLPPRPPVGAYLTPAGGPLYDEDGQSIEPRIGGVIHDWEPDPGPTAHPLTSEDWAAGRVPGRAFHLGHVTFIEDIPDGAAAREAPVVELNTMTGRYLLNVYEGRLQEPDCTQHKFLDLLRPDGSRIRPATGWRAIGPGDELVLRLISTGEKRDVGEVITSTLL